MNRAILMGMVGLALAGCAQTSPITSAARTVSRMPPVSLNPVPNIHEAINRENPRFPPTAFHPENGPVLANLDTSAHPSGGGVGVGPVPGTGPNPGVSPGPVAGGCVACQQAASSPQPPAMAPAPAPEASPELTALPEAGSSPALPGPGMTAMPAANSAGLVSTVPPTGPGNAPAAINAASASPTAPLPGPEGRPDPSIAAQPDAVPAQGMAPEQAPTTPLVPEIRQTSAQPVASAPITPGPLPAATPDPSLAAAPDAVPLPAEVPPASATTTPEDLPPVAASPETPANSPQPDPSIAAVPDAVPSPGPAPAPAPEPSAPINAPAPPPMTLPPLPEEISQRPEPEPAAGAPAMLPELPPAGASTMTPDAPSAAVQPSVPDASPTAPSDNGPPGSIPPIDLPPLPPIDPKDSPTPGPGPGPEPGPAPAATPTASEAGAPAPLPVDVPASAPAPGADARPAPRSIVDHNVMTVAADPAAIHAEDSPVKLKEAGRVAARVGDDVITLNELTDAVKEKIANLPNGYKPNRQEIMTITLQVLDMLIERSTIIQEAKRELKKPEQMKMVMDAADKVWHDEELPPLLRKMDVENEFKLKQKLAEQGKSLDAMRETFRLDFLAQGFLQQKLQHKITVTVPEMRDYYNTHLADFDRPAQWTWREVLVEVDKHANRAEARSKAEAVLGRLRRGDDFARVAQAESEGPNRAKGGLWETAPDSYSVAAVNGALKSLPIGQVSPIIEGPSSYHVVRIEARRPAGPATFAEVQDQVRKLVHGQKRHLILDGFLDKLRQQTVVTTIFDRTDHAPSAGRTTTASATPTP